MRVSYKICSALFVFVCALAHAHPHVFISGKITAQFDRAVLTGIAFTWTFDEIFSSMILRDYRPQENGTFASKTASALKAGAFDNLANYHYFVSFMLGGKSVPKFRVERFTPSVAEKGRLVYSFFVPLSLAVKASEQTVRVTVYDDTYYVAFDQLRIEDVTVGGDSSVVSGLAVEKTTAKASWPGQYMPDQLVIRFKSGS